MYFAKKRERAAKMCFGRPKKVFCEKKRELIDQIKNLQQKTFF